MFQLRSAGEHALEVQVSYGMGEGRGHLQTVWAMGRAARGCAPVLAQRFAAVQCGRGRMRCYDTFRSCFQPFSGVRLSTAARMRRAGRCRKTRPLECKVQPMLSRHVICLAPDETHELAGSRHPLGVPDASLRGEQGSK